MDQRSLRRSACAFALTLLTTTTAFGGLKHFFPRPVFVYARHPDLPMERFARGALGIPDPQHARLYLFAAYRYMEGKPFTASERAAWLRVWKHRLDGRDGDSDRGRRAWQAALSRLDSRLAQPLRRIPTVETRQYVYLEACTDDAYAQAAKTLNARIARFGARSAALQQWLEGQKAVLQSCEGDSVVPSALPASADPLIRADREYQIGAALFHSLRFDEAEAQFRRIAADAGSPWQAWAPYMVGRSLLWQARTTQDQALHTRMLGQAEAQFRTVLLNPKVRVSHPAAEYLLLRCMMITNRRAALERLGRAMRRGTWRESGLQLYLNGVDYLLDPEGGAEITRKPLSRSAWPSDDLTQWVLAFQQDKSPAPSLERWRRTRSRAWLYAALRKSGADAPDDLLNAGLAVDMNAPGGAAIRYATAELLGLKGRFDEAREQVEVLLRKLDGFPSAANRVLQLNAQLAPSLETFIQHAPRKVILASSEEDAREWADSSKYMPEQDTTLLRMDDISETIFSRRLPLDLLVSIVRTNALPKHFADELLVVTWTRAVLLGRLEVAKSLSAELAKLHPAASAALGLFTATPEPRTAALALLELPGARPYVSRGYGRNVPVDLHDEFGRNWWYRMTPEEMYELDIPYQSWVSEIRSVIPRLLPQLPFLTTEQQAIAAREWQQLTLTCRDGLDWIAAHVVASIRPDPRRADAPELLYRILDAARLSQWSALDTPDKRPGLEEARRLLTTRYRNSSWAKKLAEDSHWR